MDKPSLQCAAPYDNYDHSKEDIVYSISYSIWRQTEKLFPMRGAHFASSLRPAQDVYLSIDKLSPLDVCGRKSVCCIYLVWTIEERIHLIGWPSVYCSFHKSPVLKHPAGNERT